LLAQTDDAQSSGEESGSSRRELKVSQIGIRRDRRESTHKTKERNTTTTTTTTTTMNHINALEVPRLGLPAAVEAPVIDAGEETVVAAGAPVLDDEAAVVAGRRHYGVPVELQRFFICLILFVACTAETRLTPWGQSLVSLLEAIEPTSTLMRTRVSTSVIGIIDNLVVLLTTLAVPILDALATSIILLCIAIAILSFVHHDNRVDLLFAWLAAIHQGVWRYARRFNAFITRVLGLPPPVAAQLGAVVHTFYFLLATSIVAYGSYDYIRRGIDGTVMLLEVFFPIIGCLIVAALIFRLSQEPA
jgi:hypothetical protein